MIILLINELMSIADKRQNSNLKTSQGQATSASFNNRSNLSFFVNTFYKKI